jgi:hypothetical protein
MSTLAEIDTRTRVWEESAQACGCTELVEALGTTAMQRTHSSAGWFFHLGGLGPKASQVSIRLLYFAVTVIWSDNILSPWNTLLGSPCFSSHTLSFVEIMFGRHTLLLRFDLSLATYYLRELKLCKPYLYMYLMLPNSLITSFTCFRTQPSIHTSWLIA